MWQKDRSADAAGRLENLKELVRSMEQFESMRGFLEHVSLVMDADKNENMDAVSIMTLHSAKGLEFDTVFLPGWEEGLFPHQRALDEGGRNGLEEERRLAYVGITRAKHRLHIWFVSNRRIHGLWQSTIPSRFLDELPEEHVEVAEMEQSYGGYGRQPYGQSRFDKQEPFSSGYSSPGWQRAQQNKTEATRSNWGNRSGVAVERIGYGEAGPTGRVIQGELVAKSKIDVASDFSVGDRVFHIKFGNGNVAGIEGNKLTIDYDRAGQKRVLDGYVERVRLPAPSTPRLVWHLSVRALWPPACETQSSAGTTDAFGAAITPPTPHPEAPDAAKRNRASKGHPQLPTDKNPLQTSLVDRLVGRPSPRQRRQ
jgi:DNA helicase-2/ATP-dependent DNA helicase PcrA